MSGVGVKRSIMCVWVMERLPSVKCSQFGACCCVEHQSAFRS